MADKASRAIWRELGAPSRWKLHRPRFYRYRVAEAGIGVRWNKYSDHAPIGVAVTIGRFAYCVKWASLKTRRHDPVMSDVQ
jgi:hypothetical protein